MNTTPKVLHIKAQGWRSLPWEERILYRGTPKVFRLRGIDGTPSAFGSKGASFSQGTLRDPWALIRNAVGVVGRLDDSGNGPNPRMRILIR